MLIRLHSASAFSAGGEWLAPADLEAAPGERIVLLGPGGSGRSALLDLMTGKRPPDGGMVRFLSGGRELTKKERRRRICLVPSGCGLWDELTVWENLMTISRLYGMGKEKSELQCGLAVERCALEKAEDIPVGKLTALWRMRAGVASAIASGADLVVFSEPLSLLDPARAAILADLVGSAFGPDITVVSEISRAADAGLLGRRFILLGEGRILFDGGEDALKARGMSENFAAAAERIFGEAIG